MTCRYWMPCTTCPLKLKRKRRADGILSAGADVDEAQAKSIAITPSNLSPTTSAFANPDGGDLYIGISEQILGGYKAGATGKVSRRTGR